MARKEKHIHYLYKTTCLITNRYYIGMHSTCNLDDGYMGSGKRLRRSIRKHGKENHVKEILEFFDTRELLIEAEKKAITPDMIKDTNCMNLMGGGKGGYVSIEHYETISKMYGKINGGIHADKMKNDLEYRKQNLDRLSPKERWGDSIYRGKMLKYLDWTGKKHSDETKELLCEIRKGTGIGEKNSQYGTCWITKDGANKKIKKEDLDSYLNEGWVKGRK
jgi:hypothetical protein